MTEEQLESGLKDSRAKLAELFEDYLIVVPFRGGVWFTCSDRTWALGACHRAGLAIEQQDEITRMENREPGEG